MSQATTQSHRNPVQERQNPAFAPDLWSSGRPPTGVVVVSVEPFALWTHRWGARDPENDASDPPAPLACSDDGTTVAHADRAARAAGVASGMTLAGARQRLPELVVLPSAGPEVDAAWESFLNGLHDLSPKVAALRTGVAALAGDVRDAAHLAERTGGRVGAAATVEEAWLLAYLAEPGHTRTVAPGDDPWALLDPAPVYLLGGLGLSPAQRDRLGWLGVDRIGKLRAWTRAQITAYLGEEARALLPALHGPRQVRVPHRTPPEVIAEQHEFEDPAQEPHAWEPVLTHLIQTAAGRLAGRSVERVRVIASAAGLRSDATRRAKAPLRDPVRLGRLARLALDDAGLGGLGLEALRVELSGLVRVATPGELWTQRRRRLQAVDAVHARFPGQARGFALHDPDALRARLRWRLHDLASGDDLPWPGRGPEQGSEQAPDTTSDTKPAAPARTPSRSTAPKELVPVRSPARSPARPVAPAPGRER